MRARRTSSASLWGRGARGDERGQSIVLFALSLVALLGISGLVLDVARAYALQRYERSVADAAALAGAQDLQDNPNTPTVSAPDYPRARCDALTLLASELGGPAAPKCGNSLYSFDISGYAISGTPYTVSVKTPSPSWVDTDPYHAVQVTVAQPQFSLTVARLFAQTTWNVGQTSVAGIDHISRWAVETLRPPLPKGPGDQNLQDINSNGTNTTLTVINGDIGTNTDAVTNSGGMIYLLDSSLQPTNGFYIWHYDPSIGWNQTGNPPLPAGRPLTQLLPDPQYPIPAQPTTPGGVDPNCSQGSVPSPASAWTCLTPGLYTSKLHYNSSTNVYLEPGLYYFTGGLQVDGQLVAGNEAAATSGTCDNTTFSGCTGVTLVFSSNSYFKGNNATLIAINGGAAQPGYPNGDCAINSVDCPTAPTMITLGTPSQPYIVPLSIAVNYVPSAQGPGGCFNGTTPLNTCNSSSVIQLPGNGNLAVGGVTYAPTDSVQINGNNTTSTGLIGQLIAWDIAYSGGAHVEQYYPGSVGNGVLHLDIACSGLTTPCTP